MATHYDFVMGSNQTYEGDTFINPLTLAAGSNNTFINCTFDQQQIQSSWSCFIVTAKNNVSSVNNRFINCTFRGGHEEQAGADNPSRGALWSVSSINGSSVALALIQDPYSNAANYGVGAHLAIMKGVNIGNYYAVTTRSGNTFTLESDKFSVSDIEVGDEVTVTPAVVDCEWIDCTAYTSKMGVRRNVSWFGKLWIWDGQGRTSVQCGFSNYGYVFGSVYRRCHAIGDGLTEVGGATPRAYEATQTGFWSRGVIWSVEQSALSEDTPELDWRKLSEKFPMGVPHHTSFEDCTTTGVDQAFNGGVYQHRLHYGTYLFPPTNVQDCLTTFEVSEYPSSNLHVSDCIFTGGNMPNVMLNVVSSSWTNSYDVPTTKFDESISRFGHMWKSYYPHYYAADNVTIQDPAPLLTVDIGDDSIAEIAFDVAPTTKIRKLRAGDHHVANVYSEGQRIQEVYTQGELVYEA